MVVLFDEEVLLRNHDAELAQKVEMETAERVRKEEQRRFSRESRRIKRETAEQVERETTERNNREAEQRLDASNVEIIRALMKKQNLKAEDAMDILDIAPERRSHYAELLSQD